MYTFCLFTQLIAVSDVLFLTFSAALAISVGKYYCRNIPRLRSVPQICTTEKRSGRRHLFSADIADQKKNLQVTTRTVVELDDSWEILLISNIPLTETYGKKK